MAPFTVFFKHVNIRDWYWRKLFKDLNRKPKYDSTFSSLLLESNRMKHIQMAEKGGITHEDLPIVNEKELEQHIHKDPISAAKEAVLKLKQESRSTDRMSASKHTGVPAGRVGYANGFAGQSCMDPNGFGFVPNPNFRKPF